MELAKLMIAVKRWDEAKHCSRELLSVYMLSNLLRVRSERLEKGMRCFVKTRQR